MEINCIEDITNVFNGPVMDVIEFLQNKNLIKRNKRCEKRNCRRYCSLWQRPSHKLKHAFVCKKCKTEYNILSDSYFQNIHLEIKHIFYIFWLWAAECNSITASNIINIPRNSIYQQYRFLRDICSKNLLQMPDLILGGPGIVVQVDESVISRRKYHRGRVVKEKWVMGLYDTSTKRGMVMYIPNRRAETLLDVILKHVKPGTEIWTDCWSGYRCLSTLGNVSQFIHKTVNHSQNFVDPATNTCTNMVEGYWAKLKAYLRKLNVLNSKFLPEYIDQFLWKEHYGGTCQSRFENILIHITENYNV